MKIVKVMKTDVAQEKKINERAEKPPKAQPFIVRICSSSYRL